MSWNSSALHMRFDAAQWVTIVFVVVCLWLVWRVLRAALRVITKVVIVFVIVCAMSLFGVLGGKSAHERFDNFKQHLRQSAQSYYP
jgi:amino acid permease